MVIRTEPEIDKQNKCCDKFLEYMVHNHGNIVNIAIRQNSDTVIVFNDRTILIVYSNGRMIAKYADGTEKRYDSYYIIDVSIDLKLA